MLSQILDQLTVLSRAGDERGLREYLNLVLPEARLSVPQGGEPAATPSRRAAPSVVSRSS